jgi:hypothetical protein
MPDLDEEELIALLQHHRRTIDSSERKIVELIREARRKRIPYERLAAASGFSRAWLDEMVHQRRRRESPG